MGLSLENVELLLCLLLLDPFGGFLEMCHEAESSFAIGNSSKGTDPIYASLGDQPTPDKESPLGHRKGAFVMASPGDANKRPFMVSIQKVDEYEEPDHLCSGTLIGMKIVLTTCTCAVNWDVHKKIQVMDGSELSRSRLVAGAYDLRSDSETVQARHVSKIIIHPKCESTKSGMMKGDVGIFVPVKPFKHRMDYVEGFPLPVFKTITKLNELTQWESVCIQMGWGFRQPEILKMLYVELLSVGCARRFPCGTHPAGIEGCPLAEAYYARKKQEKGAAEEIPTFEDLKFDINTQLCTEPVWAVGPRRGDVGGPLMCTTSNDSKPADLVDNKNEIWCMGEFPGLRLIGMTSYSPPYDNPENDVPTIIARLDFAEDWIRKQIDNANDVTSHGARNKTRSLRGGAESRKVTLPMLVLEFTLARVVLMKHSTENYCVVSSFFALAKMMLVSTIISHNQER